jgi:hypothetical protein
VKLLLVLAVVLLLRAPFLNQAIQGDDIYYLAGAQHAQIDPAHPINVKYVFMGELVDMEGHPHPPLNAWFLGLLLAVFGDIREVPFHAAYVLFSVVAAVSMWSVAKRFSPHPVWATLLFLATPAFVINGNSLESDIPFLAFWMAGVALFVAGRYALAGILLGLAAMTAYQAAFLTPILAVYAWLFARRSKAAWTVVLIPPIVIAGWQLFELFTVGKLPVAVLSEYFQTYELQSWVKKLRNAGALSMHLCWIVFPALLVPAFLISRKRRDADTLFLAAWITIYFAAGIGIFFAGSARYLLPIAAPVALLVSRVSSRWLAAGFAAQMILSLSLASVNYQHWDGYRAFAASLKPQMANKRVWINGEWVRYYLEAEGGLPIKKEQAVRAGDIVVTSELGFPVHFTTGGGALTPIAQREIGATLPLRLIGLNSRSAYSTADYGMLPFDISSGPIDRVRADVVVDRQPRLEFFTMDAPEAEQHLVSGVYALEGKTRWMAGRAVILLKSPATATPLRVTFYTPNPRRVALSLDGREIVSQMFDTPGRYSIQAAAQRPEKPVMTLTITVDKTITVRGDNRELGIVLSEVGFVR